MLAILASTTTTDDSSRTIGQYTEELFKQKLTPKVKDVATYVRSLFNSLRLKIAL